MGRQEQRKKEGEEKKEEIKLQTGREREREIEKADSSCAHTHRFLLLIESSIGEVLKLRGGSAVVDFIDPDKSRNLCTDSIVNVRLDCVIVYSCFGLIFHALFWVSQREMEEGIFCWINILIRSSIYAVLIFVSFRRCYLFF